MLIKFFMNPGLSFSKLQYKNKQLREKTDSVVINDVEICYYFEVCRCPTKQEEKIMQWILQPKDREVVLRDSSSLQDEIMEVGPRLNYQSAFSSNVVSICQSVNLDFITRIEYSIRYSISCKEGICAKEAKQQIFDLFHDRMVESSYAQPLDSFDLHIQHDKWYEVPVLQEGIHALKKINDELGLAFDESDFDYYCDLFKTLGRNPTSVECFDLAQSNSEHSRHWFFRGKLFLNGQRLPLSLMDMIQSTQQYSNPNNVIKFSDNSSAIEGYEMMTLSPLHTDAPSMIVEKKRLRHIAFTAETHNFPTGISPFNGAATGTGGRIRDVQAVGRGGHVIAASAGYCFGYRLPWELDLEYPNNLAKPVKVIIEASNGASDYGNKFGEPVVLGFSRSFGMILPNNERREWIKPIMFSGGIGTIDGDMTAKVQSSKGMLVAKIGGPVYRIGMGGGAASSFQEQSDERAELDYSAVQRGDAEMAQKLNRVIRACLEGEKNPILSIHDQGAGGNANVLKELVAPSGALIYKSNFILGDPSVSTIEIWGAEYQESNAILLDKSDLELLLRICRRERAPVCVVGEITENGKITLIEADDANKEQTVVDLDLDLVLHNVPMKEFHLVSKERKETIFSSRIQISIEEALHLVLRLPSVASKRYLTSKVDRSVTGLTAQQQCVGPLHTPIADAAVIALSYFETVGAATSIGEQPIKMLLDARSGARMTVAEAVTNLAFCCISDIKDIKCSANWMWPAKMPYEGAELYNAAEAMVQFMYSLGIAIDGGKDSLSMAVRFKEEIIKSPGSLVISAYAPCPNIMQIVTPDFKMPYFDEVGYVLWIDLSGGNSRLGGSALFQCMKILGDSVPDVNSAEILSKAFALIQRLVSGHDISDGGIITTLLEMSFGGLVGFEIDIARMKENFLNFLFSEELGWVIEVSEEDVEYVIHEFKEHDILCHLLGKTKGTGPNALITIMSESRIMFQWKLHSWYQVWEETSYQLDTLQSNPKTAKQEFDSIVYRTGMTFNYSYVEAQNLNAELGKIIGNNLKIAVLREEGTNGDREMIAALHLTGFEVWDITMEDLIQEKLTLSRFRGIVFPGGFSYADVLGSAKGWVASLNFHKNIWKQLVNFRNRKNTFSLGICNGCQVMVLLKWLWNDNYSEDITSNVFLGENISNRFESRFCSVRIEKSPCIFLSQMENMILGVWMAHKEGRFQNINHVSPAHIALRYVDDSGKPTNLYPMNPNGSENSVAGICSEDGRHLAMMPHPERSIMTWQWPCYFNTKYASNFSPWLKLFFSAWQWCQECDLN